MSPATTEGAARQHRLEVTLFPTRDYGALMRVVSLLHRRGVHVQDLHYRDEPDGSSVVTVRFAATAARAETVQRSLLRLVPVGAVLNGKE